MLRYWLSLLSVFILLAAFSQEGTLVGVVKDAKSSVPLIGVTVVLGSEGTVTDLDGNYKLDLPVGEHEMTYSYVGYETRVVLVKIKANEETVQNIDLFYAAEELEMFVVSAGRYEQRIEEVTVSMEVVRPALIQNKNMRNITEAITQTPGVAIVDNEPQIRSGSGYSFGAGSRVMVMMDDLPLLSGAIGRPSWSFMPIENVEQMEVIKGASSVLYGSAALSGVINLRTAYPTSEPRSRVTLFSGVYSEPEIDGAKWWKGTAPGFVGASFFHAQQYGNVDLVLGGNVLNDTGHLGLEETEDEKYPLSDPWKTEGGAFEKRIRINGNFRYRNKKIDGFNYGVNFNLMKARSTQVLIWQNADTGLYRPFPGARTLTKQIQYTVDPFVNYYTKDGVKHSFRGRYFSLDNDNDNNQANFSDTYFGEYQYQTSLGAVGMEDMKLTAGLVGQFVDARSELYTANEAGDGNNNARTLAAYMQLDKKFFSKLMVSAGLRYEDYKVNNDRDNKPVFRAGVNYQVFKHTYVRASYGQGFRFPTIGERYIQTSVGTQNVYPNPELIPESSWNAEIGVKQGFKIGKVGGFFDVVVFQQEYENYIEFTFGQWGPDWTDGDNFYGLGFQSVNTGGARVRGIEFSLTAEGMIGPVKMRTLMGYTFTDPVSTTPDQVYAYPGDPESSFEPSTYNNTSSDTVGHPLKYRLDHLVRADIEFIWHRWMTGVSVRYNSSMRNIDKIFEGLDGTPALNTGITQWRIDHANGDVIVDLRLGFNISPSSRISFVVNNALNRSYAIRPLTVEKMRSFAFQYTLSFGGAKTEM